MTDPQVTIEPEILSFGAPMVLITTLNEDGTASLAPMSPARWLGWRAMRGVQSASQTQQNLIRAGQCVLNPASPDEADAVNRLARIPRCKATPAPKQQLGCA